MQRTILPDFLATRLAYDERDRLFYTLLPVMMRAGKVALIPKLMRRMDACAGARVEYFNRLQARLIKVWSVQ